MIIRNPETQLVNLVDRFQVLLLSELRSCVKVEMAVLGSCP